ncbi:MAG: hypothetical protein V3V25_11435 [Paracoccaceae bacterium]
METKHRWLQATIDFATRQDLDMPWAMSGDKNDWNSRCAARAKSQDSG